MTIAINIENDSNRFIYPLNSSFHNTTKTFNSIPQGLWKKMDILSYDIISYTDKKSNMVYDSNNDYYNINGNSITLKPNLNNLTYNKNWVPTWHKYKFSTSSTIDKIGLSTIFYNYNCDYTFCNNNYSPMYIMPFKKLSFFEKDNQICIYIAKNKSNKACINEIYYRGNQINCKTIDIISNKQVVKNGSDYTFTINNIPSGYTIDRWNITKNNKIIYSKLNSNIISNVKFNGNGTFDIQVLLKTVIPLYQSSIIISKSYVF